MRRPRWAVAAAGSLIAMLASCSGPDERAPVATLQHDFGRDGTLHAYPAMPAAELRQRDDNTRRMTGLPIRSPRTPYICVWRDTGHRRAVGERNAPVEELLLTCSFGATDWTPTKLYDADLPTRTEREEAVVRAAWRREGTGWRFTRLDVEIRQPGANGPFRSLNIDRELADVQLRESEIGFPASHSAPVDFRIVASVPRRAIRGGIAVTPRVVFTLSGTAEPSPDWLFQGIGGD